MGEEKINEQSNLHGFPSESTETRMGEEKEDNNKESNLLEKPSLEQTTERVSSFITLSFSIGTLPQKWQSIRTQLEKLSDILSALKDNESYDNSGKNPSLSGLLEAIMATITDCNNLAHRCIHLSNSGRLLMRSELDVVYTKFENYYKSLFEIYTSGWVLNTSAIVLSKPCKSASIESMRVYVQDLNSRLNIRSVKKEALVLLNEVMGEDEKYIKIAVETDGLILGLVKCIDSREMEVQENAVKVVLVMAGFQECRGLLVQAGIMEALFKALERGSRLGKELSTRCLIKFTENGENVWCLSSNDGVTPLLNICTNGKCEGELVFLACGVLKNLVGLEEFKEFMIQKGAIERFINLAKSKDEISQLTAIDFLQVLGSGDEQTMQSIVREGGLSVLVQFLDPSCSFSSKVIEMASRAIMNLCSKSVATLHMLMGYGLLNHILYVLRNGEKNSVQETVLKAALWLCGTSYEAKKAMGDAGFMVELIKFLDEKSYEVRVLAIETLASLILLPRNRRRFVQDEHNVNLLLQMLDPKEANSGNSKLLLSILMSLTNSSSGRKKMASSGYLRNIEKLAQVEVSDAKKIVRKLMKSRFSNIFSWHSSK